MLVFNSFNSFIKTNWGVVEIIVLNRNSVTGLACARNLHARSL